MIAFLTILYVGILALLVKLKIVPLNTFWKLSPLLWMVILLIVLFIPMQWGAPSGSINMYRPVVEIIPNVTGEVIEVPVRPLAPVEEGDVLFQIDPRPFQYKLDQFEASLREAKVNRELAEIQLKRSRTLARDAAAAQRTVDEWQARFDGAEAAIARINGQINEARFNLEQTTVRAPSKGYVIGLTLRPGQRVANLPLRSWVAFVKPDESRLVVGINQNLLRHVQTGQSAEVTFKLFPGRIFDARVEYVGQMNPRGQLPPSGTVPPAPTGQEFPEPWGVILALDEGGPDLKQIPGGAAGSAAIYTDSVTATHVIRKVMLRMEAYLNFILPW